MATTLNQKIVAKLATTENWYLNKYKKDNALPELYRNDKDLSADIPQREGTEYVHLNECLLW